MLGLFFRGKSKLLTSIYEALGVENENIKTAIKIAAITLSIAIGLMVLLSFIYPYFLLGLTQFVLGIADSLFTSTGVWFGGFGVVCGKIFGGIAYVFGGPIYAISYLWGLQASLFTSGIVSYFVNLAHSFTGGLIPIIDLPTIDFANFFRPSQLPTYGAVCALLTGLYPEIRQAIGIVLDKIGSGFNRCCPRIWSPVSRFFSWGLEKIGNGLNWIWDKLKKGAMYVWERRTCCRGEDGSVDENERLLPSAERREVAASATHSVSMPGVSVSAVNASPSITLTPAHAQTDSAAARTPIMPGVSLSVPSTPSDGKTVPAAPTQPAVAMTALQQPQQQLQHQTVALSAVPGTIATAVSQQQSQQPSLNANAVPAPAKKPAAALA
jgi:hypothetical protein